MPGRDATASSVVARYIRITLTATQAQGGSLYEFEVFGTPPPPLSQGKTATASSTYSTSYTPPWRSMATTLLAGLRARDYLSWLKVDLGGKCTIVHVDTAAFLNSGLGVKYKIEYSTDDNTYSKYADKTGAFSTPGTDTTPGAITARYLRITLTARVRAAVSKNSGCSAAR